MSTSMKTVAFLVLGYLTILAIDISFHNGSHVDALCLESEKQALLLFKQDLEDPSERLSSWEVEHDCCEYWEGVVCDNTTGHVLKLHLRNPISIFDVGNNSDDSSLGGEISPSLLSLKQLRYLDLSQNEFLGMPIPPFIGSLASLEYLNLSYAGFEGSIPLQLGNASTLRFLSLGGSDFLHVTSGGLQWLTHLPHLEHLDLSRVDLTNTPDWLQVINKLPSLTELHLAGCGLNHIPPFPSVNFTGLVVLDLSRNNFSSVMPRWILSLRNLISLDLSSCAFMGQIPEGSWNLTSLETLEISFNEFKSVPASLFRLSSLVSLGLEMAVEGPFPVVQTPNITNLKYLDLSQNDLRCSVPSWVYSFSHLESLSMTNNQLKGGIPHEIGNLTSLIELSLSYNDLTGKLTNSIGRLKRLEYLNLAGNHFNGTLLESLGHLSKLHVLVMEDNLLEGIVSEVHFTNLVNLEHFLASGNRLALKVSPDWIPPFQLRTLNLSSWHLGPKFPAWLKTQKSLVSLDISNSGISDRIPSWLWNMSSQLLALNASHNQIYGENAYIGTPWGMSKVYLNSNHLNGSLPRLPRQSFIAQLDLSNNSFSGGITDFLCENVDPFWYLNLRDNRLSGGIPDCWMNWSSLLVLELGNNFFTGNIPSSMGHLVSLRSLHLHNNHLSGEITWSLQNCTNLVVLDLSENEFTGSIPVWVGERLSSLRILNLRSNKMKGVMPPELCYLPYLQILDLAQNNFSGAIPLCIKNFTAMAMEQNTSDRTHFTYDHGFTIDGYIENVLLVMKGYMYQYDKILSLVALMDLSDNNFTGRIPEELTSLVGLISVNLSRNHFSGVIPSKIGSMVLLGALDLSRNQLHGEIPPSTSNLTFLSFLDLSFNNLSGRIPSSTQLQSFDAASFVGNELCGLPLPKNCNNDHVKTTPSIENKADDVGDGSEVDWFYVLMAIGFAAGFWGVCGPIFFIKSWRHAYFQFLDNVWTRLCMIRYGRPN